MKPFRMLTMAVFVTTVLVAPSPGLTAGADAFPICVGTKSGGLGSPSIEMTLIATSAGSFFQLTGQLVFSQPVAVPGGLVTYAVNGTAIPNTDGFWVSLVGTGYDLAKTPFVGMIAMQLSGDAAKNTLTYAKQSLDAATTQTFTRVPEIRDCPAP